MSAAATSFSRLATRRLRKAVAQGDWDEAQKCIKRGADYELRSPWMDEQDGWYGLAPVLFHALQARHDGLIEALLEAGASLDTRAWAFDETQTQANPDPHGPGMLKAVRRDCDLQKLLQAGLIWHRPDHTPKGNLVLHQAAQQGWLQSLNWLLKRSADPKLRNRLGQTALHCCVSQPAPHGTRSKRSDVIRTLVHFGAELETLDQRGRTPMKTALTYCPELIPVLIEVGADFSLLNDVLEDGQRQLDEGLKRSIRIALGNRQLRERQHWLKAKSA